MSSYIHMFKFTLYPEGLKLERKGRKRKNRNLVDHPSRKYDWKSFYFFNFLSTDFYIFSLETSFVVYKLKKLKEDNTKP